LQKRLQKLSDSTFETDRILRVVPTVIRDEIRFKLSQFDDWHLREMIGEKDPDIMRILRSQVRDADWVEKARDSSEGEMITKIIGSEIAKRGR
jgi:hypothetical protein